ncbi:hypothetical protein JXL21_06625 [Candidatus Bathyarchaeota archaeon]|nr:hypothetical protein [Candidatus Bathyarchaeota archaeon]
MRKRGIIPIHLRVTTLDEFIGVKSSHAARRLSLAEMRRKAREWVESTEGVQTDNRDEGGG